MQSADDDGAYRRIFESAGDGLILNDVETGLVVEANPAAAAMHGFARREFIGLHPTTYTHPDSHHLLDLCFQAAQSGGKFETMAEHVRRDGAPFYVEVRATAFTYRGRPCLLSIVNDVSDRLQIEQQLQEQVAARTREQAALLAISQTLASALELRPDLILDQMGVIIEYSHAALFALEELTLVTLAVRGPQRLLEAMPSHIGLDGLATLAALLNGRRPQRIADVWSDDPAARFLRLLLAEQAAVLLEGARAWMWVPLAVEDRIIGMVVVANSEPDSFTAHHADLALIVAIRRRSRWSMPSCTSRRRRWPPCRNGNGWRKTCTTRSTNRSFQPR